MKPQDVSLPICALLGVVGLGLFVRNFQSEGDEYGTRIQVLPPVITRIFMPGPLLDYVDAELTRDELRERLCSAGYENVWYAVEVRCLDSTGRSTFVMYARRPFRNEHHADEALAILGALSGRLTGAEAEPFSYAAIEEIPPGLMKMQPADAIRELSR